MPFVTGIPQALKRFGCDVEVVPGWQTRGSSSFNPGGVVGHHTAGPRRGIRPTLGICTNGYSGLPGPLCNVYQDRNGVAVVVAAGRANHAGKGGFRGLVGNSSVLGIEAESPGVEPNAWTDAQLESYPKIVAGLLWLEGRDESWYCRHATWAGGRKIDTVTLTDAWMRTRVAPLLRPPAPTPSDPTPTPAEDIMNTRLYRLSETGRIVLASPGRWYHVRDLVQLGVLQRTGYAPATVIDVTRDDYNTLRQITLAEARDN